MRMSGTIGGIKKWLRLYGVDSEAELKKEAEEIEVKASRLEREAELRKCIGEAQRRIKAVEPSMFQKRFIYILAALVGIIIVIARACF